MSNTNNVPKRRVIGVRGKRKGERRWRHVEQAHASLYYVCCEREGAKHEKVNEHKRHACTGVSFVFCRMGQVGNLQCNVSHVPPNAYSVTSHMGSVELMSHSHLGYGSVLRQAWNTPSLG